MKTNAIQSITVALLMAATTGLAGAQGVRYTIETDRAVLPAGAPENTVLKITLTAPEAPPETARTPVNLCIVLDRSGSMSGGKIEHAREAAIEAIRRLHPDDIVSLVTYDSQIETVIPAQHPRHVEWMEEQIRRITPRGMTALFGGVSQGASEIRKHEDGHYIKRMILLSDGIANVGPSQPAELARLGASLAKEEIQVSTVGLGLDYNEDLMTALAQQSGGNVYFVEHSADLPRILTAELGDAQQVVVRQVIVQINLPDHVQPVRIIGRDGRITRNQIEIPINHLQGGQSRFALVEVQVAPQAPQAVIELARARVSYEDLATQQRVTSGDQGVSVSFSEETAAVEASINTEVERDLLANRLAIAQDDAIRLADEGRPAEAAAVLREVAVDYDLVGARDGDATLQRRAQEIQGSAERVESVGMDRRDRKQFRADSFQVIQQQDVP